MATQIQDYDRGPVVDQRGAAIFLGLIGSDATADEARSAIRSIDYMIQHGRLRAIKYCKRSWIWLPELHDFLERETQSQPLEKEADP